MIQSSFQCLAQIVVAVGKPYQLVLRRATVQFWRATVANNFHMYVETVMRIDSDVLYK